MKATQVTLIALTLLLVSGLALAQDRKKLPAEEADMYTVSAKVGVMNIIEGDVSYKRDQAEWTPLKSGDELREGDAVKTGATGRAEILLIPGCYLRLAENSAFVLTNPHVYQFRIDLTYGSAIIEASALDGPMTVASSKDQFSIIKEGLYRFNVAADGRTALIVRKGRVTVGDTLVKDKKQVTVENGQPVIASLDKNQLDGFDLWSETRARDLIALNKQLSQRALTGNNAMLGFNSNAWIYSRQCGCYTFLPFGSGFSSPYGWGYAVCNPFWNSYLNYSSLYWGTGYYSGYRPGTGGNTGSGGSTGGNTGGGSSGGGGGVSGGGHHKPGRGDRVDPGIPRPPVRIDGGARPQQPAYSDSSPRYNPPAGGGGHQRSFPSGDSSPRYSPPASAPSTSSPSMGGGGGHHHKGN
ncbi:MAG: hypothetical protein ACJ74J_12415 [Blastocatellia bacterium]